MIPFRQIRTKVNPSDTTNQFKFRTWEVKTVPVRRRAIQGRWWGGRRRPSWGTSPWLASSAAADPAESGCTWLHSCCTKQQRVLRLGGNSRNQTNTGQIENAGIWTDSRKAENTDQEQEQIPCYRNEGEKGSQVRGAVPWIRRWRWEVELNNSESEELKNRGTQLSD